MTKKREIGVVAPTFFYTTETARLKGYRLTCSPGTTIHDVEVTTQIYVQGGQFWFLNVDGYADYASFSIVDKNNVLGYHTLLNLPLGTPLEVFKYIDSYQVPQMNFFQDEIILQTVGNTAEGLFLRTTYINTGANDVTIGLTYRWYEVQAP
jgi:hypothetical protein